MAKSSQYDCKKNKVKVLLALALLIRNRRRQRRRSCWKKPWIADHDKHGSFNSLLPSLRRHDPSAFKNYLRMDEDTFNHLLIKVQPLIEKQNTSFRDAIPPAERLAVALRFLASGRNQWRRQEGARG